MLLLKCVIACISSGVFIQIGKNPLAAIISMNEPISKTKPGVFKTAENIDSIMNSK
jgi:hypothetical protein